jgi:hypothetical protein
MLGQAARRARPTSFLRDTRGFRGETETGVVADAEALPMIDGYLSPPRMSGAGSFYPDRPFNSAYLGAEHQGPEKTLVVFERAAAPGEKGIKPDAQLTKDGEVVVVHQWPRPGGKEDSGRAQAAGRGTRLCFGSCRTPDSYAAGGCRDAVGIACCSMSTSRPAVCATTAFLRRWCAASKRTICSSGLSSPPSGPLCCDGRGSSIPASGLACPTPPVGSFS